MKLIWTRDLPFDTTTALRGTDRVGDGAKFVKLPRRQEDTGRDDQLEKLSVVRAGGTMEEAGLIFYQYLEIRAAHTWTTMPTAIPISVRFTRLLLFH